MEPSACTHLCDMLKVDNCRHRYGTIQLIQCPEAKSACLRTLCRWDCIINFVFDAACRQHPSRQVAHGLGTIPAQDRVLPRAVMVSPNARAVKTCHYPSTTVSSRASPANEQGLGGVWLHPDILIRVRRHRVRRRGWVRLAAGGAGEDGEAAPVELHLVPPPALRLEVKEQLWHHLGGRRGGEGRVGEGRRGEGGN